MKITCRLLVTRLLVTIALSLGFTQLLCPKVYKVKAVNLLPAEYGAVNITISRQDFGGVWNPVSNLTFKKNTTHKLGSLKFDTGILNDKANRIAYVTTNGASFQKDIPSTDIKDNQVIEIGRDINQPIQVVPFTNKEQMQGTPTVKKRRIDVYTLVPFDQQWTVQAESAAQYQIKYEPITIQKTSTGLFKKLTVPVNHDFRIFINNRMINNKAKEQEEVTGALFKVTSKGDPVLVVFSDSLAEIMERSVAKKILQEKAS